MNPEISFLYILTKGLRKTTKDNYENVIDMKNSFYPLLRFLKNVIKYFYKPRLLTYLTFSCKPTTRLFDKGFELESDNITNFPSRFV